MSDPKDPYFRSRPTQPKRPAVKVDADHADEGAETMQACPLCLRIGFVKPEIAIAFEAFCAKLNEDQG